VVAGAVLLVVFILVEDRVASPLLPLRVVFEKVRGGSLLGITLGGMGRLSVWLFLTCYFQQVHGCSAVVTGLCFPPLSLAIISASITTRLTARIGCRPLTVTGFILQVAGMVIFTQAKAASSSWAIIFPGLLLRGFGFGAMFVVLSRTSLFGVAPDDAGVASAMVSTSSFAGGSIGIALLNTIAAALTAS
jgi:MFS transporter